MEFKIDNGIVYGMPGEIRCQTLATAEEVRKLTETLARTQKMARRQNRLRRRGFRK